MRFRMLAVSERDWGIRLRRRTGLFEKVQVTFHSGDFEGKESNRCSVRSSAFITAVSKEVLGEREEAQLPARKRRAKEGKVTMKP